MKLHALVGFCLLISTSIFGQKSKTYNQNHLYYDYSVTIDCENSLYEDDFKFIVNPKKGKNYMFYISFRYLNDSLTNENLKRVKRIPIDTIRIQLSKSQLKIIYKLSKKLFVVPVRLTMFDPNIFNPPIIYDGIFATINLEVNNFNFVAFEYPDSSRDTDFNRLLNKLLEIKTSL